MKQKEVFIFLICSFILVLLWIGLNIRHSYTSSKISEIQKAHIAPLNSTFDSTTIQKLKARSVIDATYTALPTPQPETTPGVSPATQTPANQVVTPTIQPVQSTPTLPSEQ